MRGAMLLCPRAAQACNGASSRPLSHMTTECRNKVHIWAGRCSAQSCGWTEKMILCEIDRFVSDSLKHALTVRIDTATGAPWRPRIVFQYAQSRHTVGLLTTC